VRCSDDVTNACHLWPQAVAHCMQWHATAAEVVRALAVQSSEEVDPSVAQGTVLPNVSPKGHLFSAFSLLVRCTSNLPCRSGANSCASARSARPSSCRPITASCKHCAAHNAPPTQAQREWQVDGQQDKHLELGRARDWQVCQCVYECIHTFAPVLAACARTIAQKPWCRKTIGVPTSTTPSRQSCIVYCALQLVDEGRVRQSLRVVQWRAKKKVSSAARRGTLVSASLRATHCSDPQCARCRRRMHMRDAAGTSRPS
jgi:hypothetical protein